MSAAPPAAPSPADRRPSAFQRPLGLTRSDVASARSLVAAHTFWFLLPILLFGSTVVQQHRPLLYLFIAATVVLTIGLCALDPLSFCSLWVGLLFWQNSALGVWGRLFRVDAPVELVSLNTLLIYVAAGTVLVTTRRRLGLFGVPAALMAIAIGASGLGSGATGILGYFRNFTVAGVTVYLLAQITWRVGGVKVKAWLSLMCSFVAVFLPIGVVFQYLVGTSTWLQLLGLQYLPHLGSSVSTSTTLFSVRFERVASLMIDPVNTAFVAATAAIVSVLLARRLTVTATVCFVVAVLTVGKGALVMLALAALFGLLPRLRARILARPTRYLVGLLAVITVLGLLYIAVVLGPAAAKDMLFSPQSVLGRGQSTTYHISGFIAAFTELLTGPRGHGLGVGGNLGVLPGGYPNHAVALASTGGESGLGVLSYQLGVLGLIAFILAGVRVVRSVRTSTQTAGVVALLVWLCGCVFQEQSLGPLSCGFLFLVIGLAVGDQRPTATDDTEGHSAAVGGATQDVPVGGGAAVSATGATLAPREYGRLIRKQWWLILACAVLGTALGAGLTVKDRPTYTAQAELFVRTPLQLSIGQLKKGATFAEDRVPTYATFADSYAIVSAVKQELNLPFTPAQLASKITGSSPPSSVLIDISVTDQSAARAAQIANAVAAQLPGFVSAIEQQLSGGTSPVRLDIVHPARVPTQVNDRRKAVIGLGLLLGLIAGLGLALIRRSVQDRLDLDEPTSLPLPVIGTLPTNRQSAGAGLLDPRQTPALDAVNRLRGNVQYLGPDGPPRVVAVCSAEPGAGASWTAANLAASAAAAGASVCLIDADLRRPSLAGRLGLAVGPGLVEALLQDEPPTAVWQPAADRLQVVTSGAANSAARQLLDGDRVGRLVQRAREVVDLVVLDLGPVLGSSDVAGPAAAADVILLVAADRRTPIGRVRSAVASLGRLDRTAAGLILTRVRTEQHTP